MSKTSNLIADINQDITIDKATLSSDGSIRHIHIITSRTTQKCPHCDSYNNNIKDSGRKRSVWHVPQSRKACKLLFTQRRYICKDCHSTFMENLPWLHPGLNMTTALFEDALPDTMNNLLTTKNSRHKIKIISYIGNLPTSLFF